MSEEPPVKGLVAQKYELIRMIGRGGMGSVWEGKHTTLGTRVAIKFIESEYTDNEEARTRFDNEAKAAAQLQSKHAIQVHDHGVTEDGKPYIVMEYLQGEPLDKRIERYRRLPLQDVARIMGQVSRALGRAHELGIVHRDLKPENIYLVRTNDDDDEIAKVLDFGIAKIKSNVQDQAVSSSTKTGAVLGTPYYMSPEQARGLRTIDHRTDLWSLGVIAYKCVTGVLPFEGESLGDLLVKICTSPLPIPSQSVPGLPPAFDAWFARALDREPSRRFSTALELSDALALAAGISVRRSSNNSSQPNLQPYQTGTNQGSQSYGHPQSMQGASPAPYASGAGTPQPYPGTGTQIPYGTPNHYQQQQQQQQQQQGTPQPGASYAQSHHPQQQQHQSHQSPYGPGATSAPFTSAAEPPPKSTSTGLIVAAVGAGVLGVALGIFAVVKLSSSQPTTAGTGTSTATSLTSMPSTVLTIPTVATTDATDTGPLPTMTTPTSHPTATGRPTGTGKPTATAPTTTATTTATVTAHPTATVTATATAHPTATSTGIGPGF
ncbi:Stk1 family PASTA domain-containing Ser/Thr kinase [soil metagenome]